MVEETQTFEARWTWAEILILQFTWYLVLSKPPFLMLREINEFDIESEKKYDIFCLFN